MLTASGVDCTIAGTDLIFLVVGH